MLTAVIIMINSLLLFFVAITGTSRILKQLFANTSEDDSDLGVVNKMAVAELLNKGHSMDVILECLKVHYFAELVQHIFVSRHRNCRLFINFA